jgi:hypothetical protein
MRPSMSRLRFVALCSASALLFSIGCAEPAAEVAEVELPSDEQLRDRLDRAVDFTFANRHLNTKDHAGWQVVHGVLVYGRDFQIYHDEKLVRALDYLLGGGQLRGWTMHKGDRGLEAVLEAGSSTGQGHEDQWLGYLSQCGLKPDEPLIVAGQPYTVRDLITQAQWDIYDGMEATWTLMAFTTYLPFDSEWTAKDGTTWNIDRMVRMETAQDLGTSACGGTHRMYGLAVAMKRYRETGGTLGNDPDGTWEKCQRKIDEAVAAAREFQQPDGSFSTNYFARPAASPEISKRISTSGHVLEFLMVALDDKQFDEPWVKRAVLHLVECFEKTQKFDLECGALYHATHGLDLYRLRRFGARPSHAPSEPAAPAAIDAAALPSSGAQTAVGSGP